MGEQIGFLMKKGLLVGFFVTAVFLNSAAAEDPEASGSPVYALDQITVVGQKDQAPVSLEPEKITIDLETYKSTTITQNLGDVLKDMVIMDYQGESDLVPGYDTLYMRGFSSKRFVTAIDGFHIRNTGGRTDGGIVDYALLPPFLIESVEILPGSHSALYPGESIGGVVNFITRAPKRYETLKPEAPISASYGDYDTQNHSLSLRGGAGDFSYDVGYQKYLTDGYLRNNEANIDNFAGRLGYLLPNDGYVTLTSSYASADRQAPVNNDPDDAESDYDGDYPKVPSEDLSYYSWQSPETKKTAFKYRLDFKLPTSWGAWKANAYYREEVQDRSILQWVNSKDHSKGIEDGSWEVSWKQQGGQVTNEFYPIPGHIVTVGGEFEQIYDKEDYYNAENSSRLMTEHYKKRTEVS